MPEERSLIQRLADERKNGWEQAKALLDKADNEKRDLSGEETASYDTIMARMAEIDERVQKFVEDEQRAKDSEDAFRSLLGKEKTGPESPPENEGPDIRAFLAGGKGTAMEVRATGKPKSIQEYRSPLVTTTNTAGGYTVPISFYDRLIAHLIEVSGLMMAGPTVLNTNSGEQLQIPKTTAHSTAAIVTQASAITESEPTFGQVTLGAYKYGILLQVARELTTDTAVDLEGYLSMQAGRALGNGFGAHAITGTGTNQPTGVLTASTSSGVTTPTGVAGVPTADNMFDLFYSVIYPYRNSPSCAWLMKDSTIGQIRKLKDTQGRYLWEPSLVLGAPDTFNAKPVYQDPFMPATAVNAKSVLFGDFSRYFVRMVNGIRFERSDDFAFGSDVITYRVLMRADGNLVDTTGSLKYLTGAAT